MKIGRERKPLSERLKTLTENQVDQAADSMHSAFKNFEADCEMSLKNARLTIENDMRALLKTSTRLNRNALMFRMAMTFIVLLIISMSLVASWYWASTMIDKAQQASLWQLGLTIHQTEVGTVLSWDQAHLKLIDCRIGNAPAKCLQILEKD